MICILFCSDSSHLVGDPRSGVLERLSSRLSYRLMECLLVCCIVTFGFLGTGLHCSDLIADVSLVFCFNRLVSHDGSRTALASAMLTTLSDLYDPLKIWSKFLSTNLIETSFVSKSGCSSAHTWILCFSFAIVFSFRSKTGGIFDIIVSSLSDEL